MKINDNQLGRPEVLYKNTKSNIEALSGMTGGEIAYATDTGEDGIYDSVVNTWVWGRSGSSAPATTAANDFQVGDSAGNWIKKTLAEVITILRIALDSVYAEINLDSWIASNGTWSYVSADDPTFVMSVPDADAAYIGVRDRIKLTQTTAKYFVVTAKGTSSGGYTPITIYGGTDYDLANAAITLPYFSHAGSPLGFPVSPDKWNLSVDDLSARYLTPTEGAWAVPTGSTANITLPIGAWRVRYKTVPRDAVSGGNYTNAWATLSTTTNSEPYPETTFRISGVGNTAAQATANGSINLLITSKTTFRLLFRADSDGTHGSSCGFDGSSKITAEFAYL